MNNCQSPKQSRRSPQLSGRQASHHSAQKQTTMKKQILTLSSLALLASGCISQPLKISTPTKGPYDVVGEGKGEATGIMLFNLIPIGQNERFVRAYDAAVKSKGGDALIDPVIQEHWFWGYILNGYSTEITGTIIKYK
jgi:hypothetical protein